MSEVKRWEPRDTIVGFDMEPRKDGSFVLYCDHSAAQAELSALREELENEKARIPQYIAERAQTEQRLTAAEQRNEHYVWLLDMVINRGDYPWPVLHEQITNTLAALKPTESGARS